MSIFKFRAFPGGFLGLIAFSPFVISLFLFWILRSACYKEVPNPKVQGFDRLKIADEFILMQLSCGFTACAAYHPSL